MFIDNVNYNYKLKIHEYELAKFLLEGVNEDFNIKRFYLVNTDNEFKYLEVAVNNHEDDEILNLIFKFEILEYVKLNKDVLFNRWINMEKKVYWDKHGKEFTEKWEGRLEKYV